MGTLAPHCLHTLPSYPLAIRAEATSRLLCLLFRETPQGTAASFFFSGLRKPVLLVFFSLRPRSLLTHSFVLDTFLSRARPRLSVSRLELRRRLDGLELLGTHRSSPAGSCEFVCVCERHKRPSETDRVRREAPSLDFLSIWPSAAPTLVPIHSIRGEPIYRSIVHVYARVFQGPVFCCLLSSRSGISGPCPIHHGTALFCAPRTASFLAPFRPSLEQLTCPEPNNRILSHHS